MQRYKEISRANLMHEMTVLALRREDFVGWKEPEDRDTGIKVGYPLSQDERRRKLPIVRRRMQRLAHKSAVKSEIKRAFVLFQLAFFRTTCGKEKTEGNQASALAQVAATRPRAGPRDIWECCCLLLNPYPGMITLLLGVVDQLVARTLATKTRVVFCFWTSGLRHAGGRMDQSRVEKSFFNNPWVSRFAAVTSVLEGQNQVEPGLEGKPGGWEGMRDE